MNAATEKSVITSRAHLFAAGVLLLSAIGATFAPLWRAGFVYWDDRALFLTDPAVRTFDWKTFLIDLSPGGYFPLTRLSLALDYAAFGFDAASSHAVNICIHALNVGLAYRVARRAFGLTARPALFTAAVFALHPINVETVAWVSGGRKDLLSTFFTFLALTLGSAAPVADGAGHPGRRAWSALAAGVLAILSKATAVTLVPWWWIQGRRGLAMILAPVALAAGVAELMAQRTSAHVAAAGGSLVDALARAAAAFGFAVSRFVVPRGLAIYYDRAALSVDWIDVAVWVAGAALVTRAVARRDRAVLHPLAWFCLSLAPTLKLVPFGQDSVFNDRYLYAPGPGLVAFVCASLAPLFARRRWTRTLTLAPLAAAVVFAHAQTKTWVSQESLWLNVWRRYPTAGKAGANLALYYTNEGQWSEAVPFARRAIEDEPLNLEARSNYGVLLTRLGRLTEARDVLIEARRMSPFEPQILNNLGYVYLDLRDFALAREAFESAIRAAPNFPNPRDGLARARAGQLGVPARPD